MGYIDPAAGQFRQTAEAAAAVANLNAAVSNPPTQAEVQANADKVDELLASLRAAGLLT